MFKITAYGVRKNEVDYFNKLNIYNFELNLVSDNLSTDNVVLAKGSNGVLLRANNDGSRTILNQLSDWGIKYVFTRTVGYDHIDLEAAASFGITVARVPSYSPYSVAELALNLGLMLSRHTAMATSNTSLENFQVNSDLFAREIHDLTIGIFGVGRIGLTEARLYKGLGATVIGYDVNENEDAKNTLSFVSEDEILRHSDILSLHVPHIKGQNDKFVNKSFIDRMKSGSILINTARAEITNQSDIIEAIKSGKLDGFGTDVVINERDIFGKKFTPTNPLTDFSVKEMLSLYPKVVITPHIGSNTVEAVSDMIRISYQNFHDILANGTSENEIGIN